MKFNENNFDHIVEQIRATAKLGEHVIVTAKGGHVVPKQEIDKQLIFLLRKLEGVLGIES